MAGLYLHIPFCSQRCVYCDFYFVTTRSSHSSFVEALRQEITEKAQVYGPAEHVETIYLGGGTPSLLSPDEVESVLDAIALSYDTSALREVTFELNPEDVDVHYLRALRRLGVDRLSIGIQSFFEEDLAFMNRSHTAEEAASIVPLVRRAGFDNFSVDLIFGLPDQPAAHWKKNLERVTEMEVPHLSTYGLTVEPRTPLWKQIERGIVAPAGDEAMRTRYQQTMDYLREGGYEHYEISSFALPGRRAQHNQLYWEHVNYLGFGPSAHSFWWDDDALARRWANTASLRKYEASPPDPLPVADAETLAPTDLATEHIMLRLRTADGLDLDHLASRYGLDLRQECPDLLARLESEGYLTAGHDVLQLTDDGKHICDAITTELVSSL